MSHHTPLFQLTLALSLSSLHRSVRFELDLTPSIFNTVKMHNWAGLFYIKVPCRNSVNHHWEEMPLYPLCLVVWQVFLISKAHIFNKQSFFSDIIMILENYNYFGLFFLCPATLMIYFYFDKSNRIVSMICWYFKCIWCYGYIVVQHEWTVFSVAADRAQTLWLTHLHLIRKREGEGGGWGQINPLPFFVHSLLSVYANRNQVD